MSGKKAQAIVSPQVGMVIQEDDPRGGAVKLIVATDPWYVYTQAGRDGAGRRSRIKRRRLMEGRYKLLHPAPSEDFDGWMDAQLGEGLARPNSAPRQ